MEGLTFEWREGARGPDPWDGIQAWVAIVPGMPANTDGGIMGHVLFNAATPRRTIRISLDAAANWVRHDQAVRFGTSTQVVNDSLGRTAELVPRAVGHNRKGC